MSKPNFIELGGEYQIPILYEDRSVIAIDKPRTWMLVPFTWQKTNRNLHAALVSSVAAKDHWARSRNLKFIRHVHRLDAETTGVLLLAKSQGALDTYSGLFESRQMEKIYLAVVTGKPRQTEWASQLKLSPNPDVIGKMRVDLRFGKESETHFRVLETRGNATLVEARPVTGRTHQIRVHLAESGCPVAGDDLYGSKPVKKGQAALGLRAAVLAYKDPFDRRLVRIQAPTEEFLAEFGFSPSPRPGY